MFVRSPGAASHVGKIRRKPSVQLEGREHLGSVAACITPNTTTMADPEKQPEQPKANQQKMVIGKVFNIIIYLITKKKS